MTLVTNHVVSDTGHTTDHNAIATQVNQNTSDIAANKGLPVAATGATQPTRYVGRWSTVGAPASGTFAVGDFGFDSANTVQICTVAGTPGTFVPSAASVTASQQSGTTYTLTLGDAGTVVECTNASAVTVTVPPNSSVAFVVGTIINVYSAGAGGVTVAAGAGVTIENNSAALVQFGECSLRKRATDEWVRLG